MHEIDDIDRKIIHQLTVDARCPLAEIGRRVGLSTPAVHRRVRALEAAGLVAGYTVRIDPVVLGHGLQAVVALELSGGIGGLDRVAAGVADVPEVEACWSTAGASDLLLRVRTAGPPEMERLLIRLGGIPGVERSRTTILLVTHFERPPDAASLGVPPRAEGVAR
ncbi:MAG: Lrp/AsnC family transcriptional regulator [Actinobacteria bacterium]|nr:Lrp/AsnC family transcriptional regulator [Actinomycetota bacterium]